MMKIQIIDPTKISDSDIKSLTALKDELLNYNSNTEVELIVYKSKKKQIRLIETVDKVITRLDEYIRKNN